MIFNTIKRIIFLAAVLFISNNVSAQTFFNNARADYDSYYENQFGFEANANVSNTSNSEVFKSTNLVGYSAGLHFILPFRYPVTIEPIVLYAQKGFIANTPSGRFTQKSQFIDVPILAKISIVGPLKVYIGPQVSLLMTTSNKYDQGFVADNYKYYEYTGSKITYQGMAGIGFDVNKSLEIHVRYSMDISSKYGNSNQNYVPSYRRTFIEGGVGFNLFK